MTIVMLTNGNIKVYSNGNNAQYLLERLSDDDITPDEVKKVRYASTLFTGCTCMDERFSNLEEIRYSDECKTLFLLPTVIADSLFEHGVCGSLPKLKRVIIPAAFVSGRDFFGDVPSLEEVVFNGKTLEELSDMDNFPFGVD